MAKKLASLYTLGFTSYHQQLYIDALDYLTCATLIEERSHGNKSKCYSQAQLRLAHICDLVGEPDLCAYHLEKSDTSEALYLTSMNLYENEKTRAFKMMLRAIEYPLATRQLGLWALESNDAVAALEFFSMAARNGDIYSWKQVCNMSQNGIGVEVVKEDDKFMLDLRVQAAVAGDEESLVWLYHHCIKISCPCKGKKNLLLAATRLGSTSAMGSLGKYLLIHGTQNDISEALLWLFRSCMINKQSTRSKFTLGVAILLLTK